MMVSDFKYNSTQIITQIINIIHNISNIIYFKEFKAINKMNYFRGSRDCISSGIPVTGATGLGIRHIYIADDGYMTYERTDGYTGVAGYALGPTGYTGPLGPTGSPGPTGLSLTGPTGSDGEFIRYATIDGCCNLILITNKDTYTAGPINCCTDKLNCTGPQGPTGAHGASISQVVIDTIGNLTVILSNGTRLNAGNYRNLCPTGPQGPTGTPGWAVSTGPTGSSGMNGSALSTGPTGPTGITPTFITNMAVNATGNLIFNMSNTGPIDAGFIMGPTGPIGTNPLDSTTQQFEYFAALINIVNTLGVTGTTGTVSIPAGTAGKINTTNPPINQILLPQYGINLNLQVALKPPYTYFASVTNPYYGTPELQARQNLTCTAVKVYSSTQTSGAGNQLLVGVKNIDASNTFPQFADNPYANPIEYTTLSLSNGDRIGLYPLSYSYGITTDSPSTVKYGNIMYAITNIYTNN